MAKVMSDVDCNVMKVFNEVDWTQIAPADVTRIVKGLEYAAFSPDITAYQRLPRRKVRSQDMVEAPLHLVDEDVPAKILKMVSEVDWPNVGWLVKNMIPNLMRRGIQHYRVPMKVEVSR